MMPIEEEVCPAWQANEVNRKFKKPKNDALGRAMKPPLEEPTLESAKQAVKTLIFGTVKVITPTADGDGGAAEQDAKKVGSAFIPYCPRLCPRSAALLRVARRCSAAV